MDYSPVTNAIGEFLIYHWLGVCGLIVGLIAVIIALLIYSKPQIDRGDWKGYIDYRTGKEVMIRSLSISKGRCPLFNKFFFSKQFAQDFDFVDGRFELIEKKAESSVPMVENKHYKITRRTNETQIHLKRACFIDGGHKDLELKATCERSRDEIHTKIEVEEPKHNIEDDIEYVILTLRNLWNLDIVDYETRFTIPTINGLSISHVERTNGKSEDITVSESDFIIQISIPFNKISEYTKEKIGARRNYAAIAYLCLPPGTIKVTIQYKKI